MVVKARYPLPVVTSFIISRNVNIILMSWKRGFQGIRIRFLKFEEPGDVPNCYTPKDGVTICYPMNLMDESNKQDPGKEEGAAGADDEFYFSGDDDADLDRLKKFFASDLGTEQDDEHRSDAGSSSTTNIALNLNSFMDGDSGDFYTGNGDDVDFADDNVAEEFDIIFGKMDSKKNVEEILQQPTIPPEEPSNPHRHGRN